MDDPSSLLSRSLPTPSFLARSTLPATRLQLTSHSPAAMLGEEHLQQSVRKSTAWADEWVGSCLHAVVNIRTELMHAGWQYSSSTVLII